LSVPRRAQTTGVPRIEVAPFGEQTPIIPSIILLFHPDLSLAVTADRSGSLFDGQTQINNSISHAISGSLHGIAVWKQAAKAANVIVGNIAVFSYV